MVWRSFHGVLLALLWVAVRYVCNIEHISICRVGKWYTPVMTSDRPDFPFADTAAARMLSAGLQHSSVRRGISLRQHGKALGYKQAVVLSHMANGRVPIPIDRAVELAKALDIDPSAFLSAVVAQRHPDVDWALLNPVDESLDRTSLITEFTGGRALDELTPGQRGVIREATADPQAERRWLSLHELAAIELLREFRPAMVKHGLGRSDCDALIAALKGR